MIQHKITVSFKIRRDIERQRTEGLGENRDESGQQIRLGFDSKT